MERKITILHYVLLVLSLGMVAATLEAIHELSQYLADVDPVYAQSAERGKWKIENGNWQGRKLENGNLKMVAAASSPVSSFQLPVSAPQFPVSSFPFPASSFQIRDSVTPRLPNMVHLVARHANGTVFYNQTVHNLRTNAGINWQFNQMAGTTAAVCNYIALSNSGATPAAGDTALASEITTNGLARANGTPSHTANATSYTLAYTFTATGTQSVQNAGMFNASSSGSLCFENTFSQVNMNSGDTLAVTWTVNF
jgi:hypothetical protein